MVLLHKETTLEAWALVVLTIASTMTHWKDALYGANAFFKSLSWLDELTYRQEIQLLLWIKTQRDFLFFSIISIVY